MTAGILVSIAVGWVVLSGIILVSVCMLSSRISRQEEQNERSLQIELASRKGETPAKRTGRITQPRGEMVESPVVISKN